MHGKRKTRRRPKQGKKIRKEKREKGPTNKCKIVQTKLLYKVLLRKLSMTEIKCKTNTRNKNEQEQRWLSCKKKKSLSFLFCAYKYKSRRESVFLVKKRRREWIF